MQKVVLSYRATNLAQLHSIQIRQFHMVQTQHRLAKRQIESTLMGMSRAGMSMNFHKNNNNGEAK